MQMISIKRKLQEKATSTNPFIKTGILFIFQLRNLLNFIKQFCTNKEYRSLTLLHIFHSKSVHQTTPFTYMDRYPDIFTGCREYFRGKEDLKILSYGCSTGEEVLTLRNYFPNAHIIGADINKHSLKICRSLPVDDNISFIFSNQNRISKYGKFDAVFCMAVLQRKPHQVEAKGITNLKTIYPFEKFEQQIIDLDKLVKQGGLLVIHFTQYSFLDTRVASKYKALGDYNQDDYKSPVFDRCSTLINNPVSQKSIYIKLYN